MQLLQNHSDKVSGWNPNVSHRQLTLVRDPVKIRFWTSIDFISVMHDRDPGFKTYAISVRVRRGTKAALLCLQTKSQRLAVERTLEARLERLES